MAGNPIDGLTNLLVAAGLGGTGAQVTGLAEQLQSLKAINDSIAQQQAAVVNQTASSAFGGAANGGSLLGEIGGIVGGGLGVTSLVSGITSLFGGGGDQSSAPALNRFIAPGAINADAGFSPAMGGGIFGVDNASGNSPRAMGSSPQINVQVQAMDSQSFLDRSQDIANAVRQAMLETTILNDVIRSV